MSVMDRLQKLPAWPVERAALLLERDGPRLPGGGVEPYYLLPAGRKTELLLIAEALHEAQPFPYLLQVLKLLPTWIPGDPLSFCIAGRDASASQQCRYARLSIGTALCFTEQEHPELLKAHDVEEALAIVCEDFGR